jgi:hypothetical protein
MFTRLTHTSLYMFLLLGALFARNAPIASAAAPVIRTSPTLEPAFNPAIQNYVTRCDSGTDTTGTVSVHVWAAGNLVSVDSATPRLGTFADSVTLTPGQGFTIAVAGGGSTSTYNVRCLPNDFPAYTSTVSGPTQASFSLVSPGFDIKNQASDGYVAMFDSHGVPVWWYYSANGNPGDADLDPNGDLSWAVITGGPEPFGQPGTVHVEVRNLGGQLQGTLTTQGEPTDLHEAWPLANGDFLIDSYIPQTNVPIDIPGFPATVNVLDAGFQEVEPDGSVAYSWDSAGHINPVDGASDWYITWSYPGYSQKFWDWQHINAVQPYEDGYLVSFRDTGAVYYIDAATGNVIWKLGGSYDPGESLTIENDPEVAYDFGSQHDVRAWPDGTISVYDNGTKYLQAPRMARFSIDAAAGTATLVQSISDPNITYSFCCGSARAIEPDNMSASDWLIAWGATPYVTETTPAGQVVLQIKFGGTKFSYRAVPITASELSLGQLESGMDAMYGTPSRLAAAHASARSTRVR